MIYQTHRGSCLCSGIQYEINGEISDVLNCHCSMCRKLHSSAYRTRGNIASEDFSIVTGESLLTFYESSKGEHKGFCSTCGSQIFTKFDAKPDILGLPLGTLDTDPKVAPKRHVFVADKAAWHTITDDLPQYDTY